MAPNTERQLTVEQAASRLNVNPETIRRAIRSGEIVATKDRLHAGSPYLIAESELSAFVKSRQSK